MSSTTSPGTGPAAGPEACPATGPALSPPLAPAWSGRAVDFGYPVLTVRSRWASLRVPVRASAVSALLLALAVAAAAVSIRFGDLDLSPSQVLAALAGQGEAGHVAVVRQWRLPVAVAAVVFGALLGIGGAIFQSLTRNPLGSPDLIGFDAGSYTAVVVAILLLGSRSHAAITAASLAGGMATAAVVYLLADRGGVQGFRLIIVGIGVAAALGSVNAYLVSRANLRDAMVVGFWGAGSLGRVTWDSLMPALAVAGVIALAAAALAPSLRLLELGDDAAVTLGAALAPARLGLVVTGVATTALVTATAGPIGFIALVAPQLARRLTRSPGVALLPAAAMGAALLAVAHLASLLLASVLRAVPVGLLTVALGSGYFVWLLISQARRRAGVRP